MIAKSFDQISRGDLKALLADGVAEHRALQYQQTLPGQNDHDQSLFLADVSSMANTSGGDLIFGIEAPLGVPEQIDGVPLADVEGQIARLESLLRDGIQPPLPGVAIRAISGFSTGPVLLLRVPRSWAAPHMVTYKGSTQFFGRNNAGRFQLEVGEIRAAFALSECMADRIRNFRTERLSAVVADNTPTPLAAGPKLVLHVVPMEAFAVGRQIPGPTLKEHRASFQPLSRGADLLRYNLDGFLIVGGGEKDAAGRGYCQIFRTGIVESVDTTLLATSEDQISGEAFEKHVVTAIRSYLDGLQELGIVPPIFLLLSLLGVKGYEMAGPPERAPRVKGTIDRDYVVLPDVMFEQFTAGVEPLLRPLFDVLWNASNWPQSPYFREEED